MKLKDRVAIITGAASGIGKAIALEFAKEGAKIVTVDIDEKLGNKTTEEIRKISNNTIFVKCDITKYEDCNQVIKNTVETFGRIDILVNNAGIYIPKRLVETSEEEWDRTFNINLKGTFLCTRFTLSIMEKQKNGVILNIASGLGIIPEIESAAYCTSKAALIHLTKILALDYARKGIRVNSICPGPIWTPLLTNLFSKKHLETETADAVPMGRLGSPEEVAKVALFLASDDASYVTGAIYTVDGGESIG